MSIPKELRYTEEHEWLRDEAGQATIGITHHAQEQLGDVVFVELPAVGAKVTRGTTFGTVESVKAASDLYSPVTGEVTAVNTGLADHPELVNSDPYGAAWMIKVKPSEKSELDNLLTADAYAGIVGQDT